MTTEPKFIPSEAALIYPMEDVGVKVRLIDCVGFMVEGASGHVENEKERMVKHRGRRRKSRLPRRRKSVRKGDCGTFNDRYCRNHRRFISEIPRQNYVPAEERTIQELSAIKSRFWCC